MTNFKILLFIVLFFTFIITKYFEDISNWYLLNIFIIETISLIILERLYIRKVMTKSTTSRMDYY
jgi:hypothetical protein